MTKYLLKMYEDYCDEFTASGYNLCDEEDKKKYDYVMQNYNKYEEKDDTFYVGFGTNEDIEYENVKEFLDSIEVEEVSDEDAKIICKHIGGSYGLLEPLWHIESLYSEIKDSEEE